MHFLGLLSQRLPVVPAHTVLVSGRSALAEQTILSDGYHKDCVVTQRETETRVQLFILSTLSTRPNTTFKTYSHSPVGLPDSVAN